jgi:YebC/PmpR family DNA-binding regulatory protein
MAGHSQFKNIMHRKGAQDKKRAKLFTRLLREVEVAARSGGEDPSSNSRLRQALVQARSANVPKDRLERAISKSSEPSTQEEFYYEAMAPGQIAMKIHIVTDNRNRSFSQVNSTLDKRGAHMASVGFLFDHVGILVYADPGLDRRDPLMETAIEAGASDFQHKDDTCVITCPKENFFALREALEPQFDAPLQAGLCWTASVEQDLSPEKAQGLLNLMADLEDLDDVQEIWTNANPSCLPEPEAED